MRMLDFLLAISVLAVFPLVLAAYGGQLAAESIPDFKSRRKTIAIFWILAVTGVMVSTLYQYRTELTEEQRDIEAAKRETERATSAEAAQQQTLKLQASLIAQEESNRAELRMMRDKLANSPASPNADVKASVDEIQRELLALQASSANSFHPVRPSEPTAPSAHPIAPPEPVKIPCEVARLSDCDNAGLLEWGKPLMGKLSEIEDTHMADLKTLDSVQGHWYGFIIGKDTDSKWLKAYAVFQHKAADGLINCCLSDALAYYKELAHRTGGGVETHYNSLERLTMPVDSKEFKKARDDGGSILVAISGDLTIMQIELNRSPNSHSGP